MHGYIISTCWQTESKPQISTFAGRRSSSWWVPICLGDPETGAESWCAPSLSRASCRITYSCHKIIWNKKGQLFGGKWSYFIVCYNFPFFKGKPIGLRSPKKKINAYNFSESPNEFWHLFKNSYKLFPFSNYSIPFPYDKKFVLKCIFTKDWSVMCL